MKTPDDKMGNRSAEMVGFDDIVGRRGGKVGDWGDGVASIKSVSWKSRK